MGLIPLWTSDGSQLQTSDGEQIYVSYEEPTADRVVDVPPEDRIATVPED